MVPKHSSLVGGDKSPVYFRVDYPDRILMPIGALFVGFVMVSYGHAIPFTTLIRLKGFYLSWVGSALGVYIVLYIISQTIRSLDFHWPWTERSYQRLWRQLLYGVGVPMLIALSVSFLYFHLREAPLLIHDYFSQDFGLVFFMLVLLNLAYYLYYRQRYYQEYGHKLRWADEPTTTGSYVDATNHIAGKAESGDGLVEAMVMEMPAEVLENESGAPIDEYKDTAYFKSERKVTYSYGYVQGKSVVSETITELYSKLDPTQYFMVRRGVIVHRGAIRSATLMGRRYRIFLEEPYQDHVCYTSKSQAAAFRKWFYDGAEQEEE